jgi:flagellar basal body-associated protein FliL
MLALDRFTRLALALNALLVAVVLFVLPGRPPAAAAAPPVPLAYPTVPLEGSLVHLLRGESDSTERNASIKLDLELRDGGALGPVVQHMPALRESVLRYFADRTAREIKAPGSLERIKQDLLPRLNRILPAHIRALYITQIVVQ